MGSSTIQEGVNFKLIGRISNAFELQHSRDGNTAYTRLELKVAPKDKDWKYKTTAFGDVAKEIVNKAEKGDRVELRGDVQWQKGSREGWELQLITTRLETVEHTEHSGNEAGPGDDNIPF